jgi:hypothetical protein
LLDDSAAHEEDNSALFFKLDGSVMLEKLKMPTPLVASGGGGGGGAASLGAHRTTAAGGAAGLGDIFSGIKSGAIRFLNYLAYYEMKKRAGTVGQKGVAPLLDRLADHVQRIHLVGHSFGCRAVTAAAATSTTDKLQSMSLLQAAFSHNGFSKSMNGFFRSVVDNHRIKGPIVVTYTPNDRAVRIAYPVASRLSGTVASLLATRTINLAASAETVHRKWSRAKLCRVLIGCSRWGALQLAVRSFSQSGRQQIHRRSKRPRCARFVTGKEVAWAISRAMA